MGFVSLSFSPIICSDFNSSLDDLDHHLVLIEDRKFNCCQDNKLVNHWLMEQETLLQATVIRIGELEHQLDTVCHNVSSLLCKD